MDNIHITASSIIDSNTLQYGNYVIKNLFPCPIDGFKRVRRRIIYTNSSEDKISGNKLISNTIAIHNYGDQSIYDTASKMCSPFRSINQILVLHGNNETYSGNRQASQRYVDFSLSTFGRDIFYTSINFKTLPMIVTEDMSGREIDYFIPKLPTALLYANESVGFGYSSYTAPLNYSNVCDLVIEYAKCKVKHTWNMFRLPQRYLPSFPIKCYIKNISTLLKAYKHGKFEEPIMTEGLYVLKSSNTLLIRTLGYGASTSTARKSLVKCLRDKKHWLVGMDANLKPSSDNAMYLDFYISIKRNSNIFELIDKLSSIVKLRHTIHPFNNYVLAGKIHKLHPPETLKIWYIERYRSILGAKKYKQQSLQDKLITIEVYITICDHVDEVIKIIQGRKKAHQLSDIYDTLKKRFNLSLRQCEILVNAKLIVLSKMKRKALELDELKCRTELTKLTDSFKSIDDEIVDEVTILKKKYSPDDTYVSRVDKYIGYISIRNMGILQIRSHADIATYSNMFKPKVVYHTYDKCNSIVINTKKYLHVDELPYTAHSDMINVHVKSPYRVFVRKGNSSTLSDRVSNVPDIIHSVFGNKALVLHSSKGLMRMGNVTDKILYVVDNTADEYLMISSNTATDNHIRIQRIRMGDKLISSAAGSTKVLIIIPIDATDCTFNLIRNKKHSGIHIHNVPKLVSKYMTTVTMKDITISNNAIMSTY